MWQKPRTETPSQSVPPPAVAPASVRPAATPCTAIGTAISIVGDIYSEEDLFIDGDVQGKLEIKDGLLTVGPNGKAHSDVKAREVVIMGKVQGDIDASQKITVRKEGSLIGNIRTTGIVIDDDAYFKGSIDIVRKPKQ